MEELKDEARQSKVALSMYRVYSIRASGYEGTGCIYAEVLEKENPSGKGVFLSNGQARYRVYIDCDGASFGFQQSQSKKKGV